MLVQGTLIWMIKPLPSESGPGQQKRQRQRGCKSRQRNQDYHSLKIKK